MRVVRRPTLAVTRLRALAAAAASVAILACTAPVPTPSAQPSATPLPSATPTPSAPLAAFPDTVLGLPVLSVDEAATVLQADGLNGREGAIAGYWSHPIISCPQSADPALLEGSCVFTALAARPYLDGTLGTWPDPDFTVLGALVAPETSGVDAIWTNGRLPDRSPAVVVIAHTGDVRYWQCGQDARERCRKQLLVDRVAWVDGRDIDLAPVVGDVSPRSTVADVAKLPAGQEGVVLSAYATDALSIGNLDPRMRSVGEGTVWFVRYATGVPAQDGTLASEQRLIDDDTRAVLITLAPNPSADYAPARLALGNSYDRSVPLEIVNTTYPRFELRRVGGEEIGLQPPPGWDLGPIVLPAGQYELRDRVDSSGVARPGFACETLLELGELADVRATVSFTADSCHWDTEP